MPLNATIRFIIIGSIATIGNYLNSQNLLTSILWGFGFVAVVGIFAHFFLKH